MAALEADPDLWICAGTVAEALIVAERRNVGSEMHRLIDGLGFQIASLTPSAARQVTAAYGRWGKGVHPAGLNFGDCFAYVPAEAQRRAGIQGRRAGYPLRRYRG